MQRFAREHRDETSDQHIEEDWVVRNTAEILRSKDAQIEIFRLKRFQDKLKKMPMSESDKIILTPLLDSQLHQAETYTALDKKNMGSGVNVHCIDSETGDHYALNLIMKMRHERDPKYFVRNPRTGEIESVRDHVSSSFGKVSKNANIMETLQECAARECFEELRGIAPLSIVNIWRALATEGFHYDCIRKDKNSPRTFIISLGRMTKQERLDFCARFQEADVTSMDQTECRRIYFHPSHEGLQTMIEFEECSNGEVYGKGDMLGAPNGDING